MARKTNTELITDLMDFAKSGPLMQAFILEAVSQYAKRCAAVDPAVFDSPILNGAAWHRCAVEAKAALEAHLST